jgi:hypothetical protein
MKKIYIIFLAALTLGSCQDVLDLEPQDRLSDAAIWGSEGTIQGYVDYAYQQLGGYPATRGGIPRYFTWGHMRGEATDEAYPHIVWGGGQDITNNRLNPETAETIGGWRWFYLYLQHINVFFDNYEQGRFDVPQDKLDLWLAEMHFLRAWYHNQMMKAYGGIIIADKVFSPDDPIDQARASYDDCVQFVLNELDLALEGLPDEAAVPGRVTSGAALAVKAEVLLHYASPLHNPSNDMARWEDAADACKEVIDLPQYSLYGMPGSNIDFHDVWYHSPGEGNTEIIMSRYYYTETLLHFSNFPSTTFGVPSWGGWGLATPLQELVDAFQNADGTDFDRSVQGQDPYSDRELRFYETILYDGAPFSVTKDRVPAVELVGHYIESGEYFEGEFNADGDSVFRPGYDRQGGVLQETKNFTRTGYYCHKHVHDDYDSKFVQGDVVFVPFMRLTAFYLHYAECLVMLGEGAEARNYVLPIRQRAMLPDESLPAVLTMDDIMHEKRVELAYEDYRYFDVRRWKILDQTFVPVTKVNVKVDNTVDPPKRTFEYSILQERIYDEKLYFTPIPQSEINKNPSLEQNPGY